MSLWNGPIKVKFNYFATFCQFSQKRSDNFSVFLVYTVLVMILISCQEMDFIELFKRSFSMSERSGLTHFPIIISPSVRWYYGFSTAAASAAARRPWRRQHSNSNIQPISFKFCMWVDTPMRYFAIEILYPPRTRTTAFAAKWHSYPPNLQNAISP